MPQFDAFPHPVPSVRRNFPLAVTLRSDLMAPSEKAIIAPLVPRKRLPGVVGRYCPVVQVDDEEYVVMLDYLTAVPVHDLPRRIANLSRFREALLGAVDLLFYGV